MLWRATHEALKSQARSLEEPGTKPRRATHEALKKQARSLEEAGKNLIGTREESRRNQGRIYEILGKILEAGMLRAWRARHEGLKSQGSGVQEPGLAGEKRDDLLMKKGKGFDKKDKLFD